MQGKRWFYFVLIGSFLISLTVSFIIKHPVDRTSDSHTYDAIAMNLVSGSGYTDEGVQPTMTREPLYPFFLAFIYSIAGHNYAAVKFIQMILFLITTVLAYKIAKMIFDENTARYAMIFTAFFPTLLNYPSYILSETVFTFLVALFVFSCVGFYLENKLFYCILSGLSLGLLILCKCAMLPFIVVLILWGIFFCKDMPKAILMVLISLAVIFPWSYRNYVKFDTFALRGGSESALAIKVQKLDYTFDDFKKAAIFTLSEGLGKKMFPDAIENPRDFLFKEDILVREKILPELKREGHSDKEIGRMMRKRIMERPIKYLAVSFLDLLKLAQFSYLPILNQPDTIEIFNKLPHGRLWLSLLRAVFRPFAGLLILFSIIGMYIKRGIWKRWIFLLIIIAYALITYSLIYGDARYSVPFIPYYIIFSIPAVLKIKESIINKYVKKA